MRLKCKNCLPTEGIAIPGFSEEEKRRLISLAQKSRLDAVNFMYNNLKFSLQDAKYIATHINCIYGHCNRCNYEQLQEEYINCPRCGALNLNWKLII